MSTGVIVFVYAVTAAFVVVLAGSGHPTARLFARMWEVITYRLGVDKLDRLIWAWQERRHAVELDEVAVLADSAGLADSAAMAREAAARARLRAGGKG